MPAITIQADHVKNPYDRESRQCCTNLHQECWTRPQTVETGPKNALRGSECVLNSVSAKKGVDISIQKKRWGKEGDS